MKKSMIFKAAILSALATSASPMAAISADHSHHKVSQQAETSSPNALVEEMRALDGVFREIVSAVALGDGHKVHQALETMHGKMEKTQEALHTGHVKLRKNASKAAEFERMDKEFHANLEKLAGAAHKNDGPNMTLLTKKLLDGCVSCHKQFRP